jgi:PAS domain S-box-containing protein
MTNKESQKNNQSENDLLLSEERLKMVLEGSDQGFGDWNMETDEVNRNNRWAQILGYSTINEFSDNTESWTHSIHPDDRDAAWKSIQDHIEGRTTSHKMEYRMLTKDGGTSGYVTTPKLYSVIQMGIRCV